MVKVSGTNGVTCNAVVWAFTGVSILLVALRLLARVKITKFYGEDDFFIVLALLFDIIYAILNSLAVANGFGSHFHDLSRSQQVESAKWDLITHTMASWALQVPKLAVVALLVRVFAPRRWVTIVLYTAAGFGIAVALVTSLMWVLQCSPIEANWNHAIQGTCWSLKITNTFSSFQFSLSVILDFAYALFPAPILWGLQMSRSRKIVITVNMGLGMIAGAVGIYKLSILRTVGTIQVSDITYYESTVAVWIAVEGNLLIYAACIPTIGPVVHQIINLATTRGSSGTPSTIKSRGKQKQKQDRYERMTDERRLRRQDTDLESDEAIVLQSRDTTKSSFHKHGNSDEEADVEYDEPMHTQSDGGKPSPRVVTQPHATFYDG